MKTIYYFFLFVALVIFSCDKRKVEYTYFSNGKVKTSAEKLNGKNDGVLYEYFSDGKLKLRQNWKNGLIDGVEEEYYPSGKLYIRALLKNDNFINLTSYYENGQIKTKQFYDASGDIFDVHKFTNIGLRDSEAYPFFHTIPYGDTLKLGKEAILKARIVNVTDSMYRNGQFIVTSAIDTFSNNLIKVKDTIALITPQNHFDYVYKFTPKRKGVNFIHGQFVFKKIVQDEVTMNISVLHYPIYVIE